LVASVEEFEIAEPILLTGPCAELSRGGTGELGDEVFHEVQDDRGWGPEGSVGEWRMGRALTGSRST